MGSASVMTTAENPAIKPAILVSAAPLAARDRLMLPAGVRPFQLNWPYIIVIAGYHALALRSLYPPPPDRCRQSLTM